ncbi:hypothetical protein CS022_13195 [Veronia nyctiphanis]|uniref:Uncharacterized protein n=1 Tax=Veronia nyctiphanis TaxID=1278244 RepID=A0A4Q0YQD3_9GAMM|nr:PH domain-containing protein [Veronia nyctiphanis]RXJ72813.1 hypothetical protein CS022_13195 [Veronia nyctiphanis]
MPRRPISLTQNTLIIRYGVFNPLTLPISNIESISLHSKEVKGKANLKVYNHFGVPNIEISLREPDGDLKKIYLGVDNPNRLIEAVSGAVAPQNQ